MYKTLLCLLVIPMIGCSQVNWDTAGPRIEAFTELTARVAFAREDVAIHKDDICKTVELISPILNNFEDPDITLGVVKSSVVSTLDQELGNVIPGISDNTRRVIMLVVGQVLDVSFSYIRGSYESLINEDEPRAVLMGTRAVSLGLGRACTDATSLNSFGVEKK